MRVLQLQVAAAGAPGIPELVQEATWMSTQRQGAGTNHLEQRDESLIMELQFWSVIIGCKFLLLRTSQ